VVRVGGLFNAGAFDAPGNPVAGALLEPHESFFALGQRQGVLSTGIRACLKRPQPVDYDGKQGFLADSVWLALLD
jgi:hypothetical protein